MKTCLVLEGGAMRGMYTAGALDVFYNAGIKFDGIIGVSAGAAFGVNYLSGQPGRVIRYNKRFNADRHYMGLIPLLKTGNIVDTDYAYDKVPRELDPFDGDTFDASGVPFWAVVTNALARAALERLGVLGYFSALLTCEGYGGKDKPDIFLNAAAAAGGIPENTAVFEDSLHALLTAKQAGFLAVGVYDSGEPQQEKLKASADYYFRNLSDCSGLFLAIR